MSLVPMHHEYYQVTLRDGRCAICTREEAEYLLQATNGQVHVCPAPSTNALGQFSNSPETTLERHYCQKCGNDISIKMIISANGHLQKAIILCPHVKIWEEEALFSNTTYTKVRCTYKTSSTCGFASALRNHIE